MPNDPPHTSDRPEAPAVATRAVVVTALGLLVFVGISLIVLHLYFGDRIDQAVFVPPARFAAPQLQIDDAADLAKLQAEQSRKLNSYAWIDRDNGIATVPIEQAMKQIVARGADAYAPLDVITPAPQSARAAGGTQP